MADKLFDNEINVSVGDTDTDINVGADVQPKFESAVRPPSAQLKPKPTEADYNQFWNSTTAPDFVTEQYKVPWYNKDFEKFRYPDGGASPATPKRYTQPKTTAFIPNVVDIYKKYNVPIDTKTDFIAPQSWFQHNVPLAVWLPDNRIIQASTPDEFAMLLYTIGKDGGIRNDSNIPQATYNTTFNQMKRMEDQGDFTSARQAMWDNVRAGNTTEQQYREYVSGEKNLDQLFKESNYTLGSFNKNPINNPIQVLTYQGYVDWTDKVYGETPDVQFEFDNALREVNAVHDYLLTVQDTVRANITKKAKDTGISELDNLLGEDTEDVLSAVPDIPDNWLEWDALPDNWRLYDSKGQITALPANLSYSPKALKTKLDNLKISLENHISQELPDGYKARIDVDPYTSEYSIRFIAPNGLDINGNLDVEDDVYDFTGSEVNEFVSWAKVNPEKYVKQMLAVSSENPTLAKKLIKLVNPDYNDEQIQLIVDSQKKNPEMETDQVVQNALRVMAEPKLEDGTDDPIARNSANYLSAMGEVIPNFLKAIQETRNENSNRILGFLNSDKPDRVKQLGLLLVGNNGLIGGALEGLEQIGNIFGLVDDTYGRIVYEMATGGAETYNVWKQKTDFTIAGSGIKAAFVASTPNGMMTPEIANLAMSDITPSDISPTREEYLPWTNPLYWFGGGEAKAAATASKAERTVAELASMFARGDGMEAVVAHAKKIAPGIGVEANALLDDALTLIAKDIRAKLAPSEFKASPILEDIRPGEPYKPGEVIQTDEGLARIVEPEYREMKAGEPMPESNALYHDTVTGKDYVRKDYVPESNIPEGKTTQATKEPVKPVEEVRTPEEAAKPSVEAVNAEKAQLQPTRTQQARTAVQEAWDSFKEMNIVSDPKVQAEKQARLYSALVELAKAHIDEGIKTIEEFAKATGIEINAAVKAAWKAAADGTTFEALSASTKNSLNSVKMAVKRNFNTEQQAAVDHFKSTADNFDEVWDTILAERQAELKKKTARLAEAQANNAGAERIAAENEARRGLLTDIGITPDKMLITPEDAKALDDMIYASGDLSPWEKANASKALADLVNDWRIPRPHEQEYFKKVFGYDVINTFKLTNKPRLGDYVTELLYNSFLSPKSNVVNFGGNAIGSILSPGERFFSSMFRGNNPKIAAEEAAQDIVGLWTGIPDGLRSWLDVMKRGGVSDEVLKGEVNRVRAFKGTTGRVVNFNTDLMYATDELFKSINQSMAVRSEAYKMALGEGFKGEQLKERLNILISNPPEELVKKATEIAEYRLYRGESDMANKINRVRDWEIIGGIKPMQLVIPFVKTPINLVKFGLERTPAALFNPKLIKNIITKNPEYADQLGRAVIGSTIATGIVIYAKDGMITGEPPKSVAERDEFYRLGKQPYSLKVGNKWISYQRLEPFNQIFLQAANIIEAINNKDQTADELAMGYVTDIGKNAVNQTFLSGLSDIINAISEPERYGEQWYQKEIASLMPFSATSRLLTQMTDETIRQPQDVGQQIQSNIPGLSQNVPAKINVFGEEQKRETPALIPYSWTTENKDILDKTLADAGVTPGFVGNSITVDKKKYKLNDTEQHEYQVLAGQTLEKYLMVAVNSGAKSKELLEKVISKARDTAKAKYVKKLQERGRKPD